jgi:hypothetical protein
MIADRVIQTPGDAALYLALAAFAAVGEAADERDPVSA